MKHPDDTSKDYETTPDGRRIIPLEGLTPLECAHALFGDDLEPVLRTIVAFVNQPNSIRIEDGNISSDDE